VEEILGSRETGVTGVRLKDLKTGEGECFPRGVFIGDWSSANTDLFKGQLDMDEVGYIKTRDRSTATNIPGVFACGDAQDSVYRQAVTAAGTRVHGCDGRRAVSRQSPIGRGSRAGGTGTRRPVTKRYSRWLAASQHQPTVEVAPKPVGCRPQISAFVEVLLLGVWLGSMIFFSFAVAPSAFAVLPTREMAGVMVTSTIGKIERWALSSVRC